MKKFTVSIIGCGSRGCDTYGSLCYAQKDKFEIVALCDVNASKVKKYGDIYGVRDSMRFTDEDEFFSKKHSDALVIATLDRDHVRQAIKAIRLGYVILLEKPVSSDETELKALLSEQKKYNAKIMVCHVLRYAPAFLKAKELLNEGTIGDIVSIDATEQIAYWHFAHSYVRGNWRKEEDTAPMILAKCCHDLDLLQYYAGSEAVSVNSIGDLTFFKPSNAPSGSAERCVACKLNNTCPYSAVSYYVENYKSIGSPENQWPYNVVCPNIPDDADKLLSAIRDGNYGKCVFHSDNDVCDNQIVTIRFKNGVNAVLKAVAFTHDIGRRIFFYGTKGEIEFDETRGIIVVKKFGEDNYTIYMKDLTCNDEFGHGGGDVGIIKSFYQLLTGNENPETSLEKSVESHLIGICAEKSRKTGGKCVLIDRNIQV